MRFVVPQFIEREAKIIGPLTFKQFVFVGIAGAFCIFLYFTVPLAVFAIAAVFFIGIASALAFLKIEKIPLPIYIKNLFVFLFKPKVYLWKKKTIPPKFIKREKEEIIKKQKPINQIPIKVSDRSRLKEVFTRLETKDKL